MKIAVLFHRFGPYHVARLQAAGRHCDVVGIELSGESAEYAWDPVQGKSTFKRMTVWPEGDIRSLSPTKIKRLVTAALTRANPDAVAVHGWSAPDALAALSWGAQTHTPLILMSASSSGDFIRSWWREAIKRRIVDIAQAGLVGGARHATYLEQLGIPASCIYLGYDVVDNAHFRNGAQAAKNQSQVVRTEKDLPDAYFLASARFIPKKNLPRLIEAYALYRDLSVSTAWDLVLLGDGPERPAVEAAITSCGVRASVHLPGFKQYNELPAYYGLAAAFVHASTREQWGLVVNEAMAAGLPVLVSNRCGCVDNLVHEGRNGYTFDPEDTAALADQMMCIASADDRRDAMGKASRAIIDNWSLETFATNLMKAAKTAMQAEVEPSGLLDHLLLNALMYR